jgi:hypothetical protein
MGGGRELKRGEERLCTEIENREKYKMVASEQILVTMVVSGFRRAVVRIHNASTPPSHSAPLALAPAALATTALSQCPAPHRVGWYYNDREYSNVIR